MSFARRHRKKLIALAVVLLLPVVAHLAIVLATRMTPPEVPQVNGEVAQADGIRRLGPAYARTRGSG